MRKHFVPAFFDGIISGGIVFIVISSIFSFIKNKTFLFILSGILAAVFSFLIIKILLKRERIRFAEKAEKEKTENLLYHLKINDEKTEFIKAFSKIGKDAKLLGSGLILCDNEYILPHFKFKKLTFDDYTEIFLTYKGKDITIYTEKPDEEISVFLKKHFKFTLKTESDTFALFSAADLLPTENYFEKEKIITLKNFSNLFDRKKFFSFFFSGLTFLLFSYLTPFRIYYLFVGAILLSFSVCCLILPKRKSLKV